jgi:hypothetical protein
MKHSHRITVLDKIEDNYDYGQLSYPTSLNDIKQVEEDNRITLTIFRLDSNNKSSYHKRAMCFIVETKLLIYYIYKMKRKSRATSSTLNN